MTVETLEALMSEFNLLLKPSCGLLVKPRTLLWREATDLGPLKVVQESRHDSQEVSVERGI